MNNEQYGNRTFLLAKLSIIIAILVSISFIAYNNVLDNAFLAWDDSRYVSGNPHIRSFSPENLYWMLTSFYEANWHPLTWLSHAIDFALYGLEPWGHHLSNVLIHCANTVWVFILAIVLMTGRNILHFSAARLDNYTLSAAAIAALLFGVHPQHVESVAWVSERKDVLCLFFVLPAILAYIVYTLIPATKKHRKYWYICSLCCFVLALMAKPMAVTVPAILLLMDVYPLKRFFLKHDAQAGKIEAPGYKTIIIEKLPFFLFTSISIVLTLLAQKQAQAIIGIAQISFDARLLNAFNSVVFYLSKLILPVHLSPFYPHYIRGINESYSALIPAMAIFLISLVCIHQWYQKKYYWLAAWLFYLITLSPVIGIIQVGLQAAADRYAYLPTIPFYILTGIGIAGIVRHGRTTKLLKSGVPLLSLAIVAMLTSLTVQQTLVWRNDVILWKYAVSTAPDKTNSSSYYNLAVAYLNKGRRLDALKVYKYMLQHHINARLDMSNIYSNMGWIYYETGVFPEARKFARMALAVNPNHPHAQELLTKLASD